MTSFFEDLFVLEMANNHWGSLERGLEIVHKYTNVVRNNKIRSAIKLQLRDVDTFVHKNYVRRNDIRYVKKTLDTKLSENDIKLLVESIRENGHLIAATPFDEKSVWLCEKLGIQVLKIASSDVNDGPLLRQIIKTKKPTIVSLGGTNTEEIDRIVGLFQENGIPLAINHCVSLYPTEDADLQMNRIDFLKSRYSNVAIGFSTHEYHDWETSMIIAYAKGARVFERHIDIEKDNIPVSPYCSLPDQIDLWFKAFKRAKTMCGIKYSPKDEEIKYLNSLHRGLYAACDLLPGQVIKEEDLYMSIPCMGGQASCCDYDLLIGKTLKLGCKKDDCIMLKEIS